MRNLMGSLVIACSMYSRIPMPKVQWTKERMKYVMCFFPLIGLGIGICLWAWGQIAGVLGLGLLSYCLGGTLLPLGITGGIHMDGFLDVSDARSSYGEPEKKLEILKDPHVGAFAVIKGSMYLFLYLAVFSELPVSRLPAMGAVFVITRAMSGLSVVLFPKARKEGLAAAFSQGARERIVSGIMAVYFMGCLAFLFMHEGWETAAAAGGVSAVLFWRYYRIAVKEFGGMTGDLAGWFLQCTELALMAVIAILSRTAG